MEQPNDSNPPCRPPPPSPSLLLSLPDAIVLNILARISTSYYPTLSLVSKSFRSLILSEKLDMERSYIGTQEQRVSICLQSPTHPFDRRWFTLWIKPYDHQSLTHWTIDVKYTGHWLLPATSSYSRPLQILQETVDPEAYQIGGHDTPFPSTDVWVYDKLIGKWHKAPSMMVARKNAHTCAIDGKLYVMGGCEADESKYWAEVFDSKTQTWEALPDPGVELRYYSSIKKLHTDPERGKVYVRGNNKKFVYLTKERRWEVFYFSESICEIEHVCYSYWDKKCWWYDTKCQSWRPVKGLIGLEQHYKSDTEIGNYGGKLVVFWACGVPHITATKEIWCAVISLKKSSGGEVWGQIEWFDVVLIAPQSYTLLHCMDSLQ